VSVAKDGLRDGLGDLGDRGEQIVQRRVLGA
jgi:hypothetical protein